MILITYSLVFLFSLYGAFLLLAYPMHFSAFIRHFKKKITLSFILSLLPKALYLCSTDPHLSIYSIDLLIIDACFFVMMITDIIEKSVFTIVPLIPIFYRITVLLILSQYYDIAMIALIFFSLYVLYYFIHYLFLFLLKKESIGFGDLLCFFMLGAYHNGIFLILVFWIASLIALILFLFQKMCDAENRINHEIPFIPYLYVAYYITLFFGESIVLYAFS